MGGVKGRTVAVAPKRRPVSLELYDTKLPVGVLRYIDWTSSCSLFFQLTSVAGDGGSEGDGEIGPGWSITTSVIVLLLGTGVMALVSDTLVDSLNVLLEKSDISQTFIGVTFLSIVPSIPEFINAILFATQDKDNIALAIEIGNSSAVQIALIQIPAIVVLSTILNSGNPENEFSLIFPNLDLFAVIFSVIVINYITVDGKSNYFQGVALVIIYVIFIAAC